MDMSYIADSASQIHLFAGFSAQVTSKIHCGWNLHQLWIFFDIVNANN